jgi:DNA-binding MurR/RpiR family transcriptional regulator
MRKELYFDKTDTVNKRIETAYSALSKQHKTIADYVTEHLDKVSYMTVNNLADNTDTSVATVLRFTDHLGYESYPDFRQAVKNQTKIRLTAAQRIHMPGFEKYSFEGIKDIFKADMDNIKATSDTLDEVTFAAVVDSLIGAEKIYLIGSRTTTVLAEYFSYYLNLLLKGKVKLVQESVREPFEQLMNATERDVVVGLSFPRYSTRTIKYMQYCKKNDTRVVGITDLPSSPIYPLCDYVLFAKSNIVSFVDTLVAPLSLINALIIGVGLKNEAETKKVFENLEDMWNEYLTYDQYDN